MKLIENGIYEEGTYLPSVRDVAKDYGINPNTVQKAYKLLEELGYVTIVNKKGAYVNLQSKIDDYKMLKEELLRLKEKGSNKEEIMDIVSLIFGGEGKWLN